MQIWRPEPATVAIRRVHAVVNPVSGGVGPGAADDLAALFAELGLADHRISELRPGEAEAQVRAGLDADPDVVVVLGGDGTARLVAELCGPDGPLVAPLSGGTMNKLGRALYGAMSWREALTEILQRGVPRWVPGGEVDGHAFFCGAVLGSPAFLAPAREAIRAHDLGRAWRRAVLASRKAFRARLSYDLDGDAGRAVAISLRCPTVAATPEAALMAAVLDPPDPEAGFREGLRLAFSNLIGDWRDDPQATRPCHAGRAWASRPLPAMLDGEFFRLPRAAEIHFRPRAFRALAPAS